MKFLIPLLLTLGMGAQQPTKPAALPAKPMPKTVCWDGFGTTKDDEKSCKAKANHDWITDHTGEHMPSGDGCNTSTCMDAACRFSSSTLMACAYHPNQIVLVPDPPKPAEKQVQPPVVKPKLPNSISDAGFISAPTFSPALGACGWMGTWDDDKKVCAIHVYFGIAGTPIVPPITCSPVGADADGSQHMICWYKPVGVPKGKEAK